MTRTLLLAAAALVLAAPIAASAKPATDPAPASFERNGVAYSYVTELRNGHRVLDGTANGRPFRLVVRKHKVSGIYDNRLVYFSLREAKPEVVRERFASR